MTDDEKILAAMETLMGLLDDTNVAYAVKHEKGEALYDAVMREGREAVDLLAWRLKA